VANELHSLFTISARIARSHILAFTSGNNLLFVTPTLESNKAFLDTGGVNFSHGLDDILEMLLSGDVEVLLDLVTEHEGDFVVLIDVEEHALVLLNDGSGDHITGTESLIVLLVCEDILSSDHGLGGSVLAGLGSGESSDLAGEGLLHDDEGAGLHATSVSELSVKGTGIALFELVLVRRHI